MSPCNNLWETVQGILFSPLCRVIGLFYVVAWDWECKAAVKKEKKLMGESHASPKKETQREGVVTRGSAKKIK